MPFVLEWIILATMQHKFVNFHHTVKPVAHIFSYFWVFFAISFSHLLHVHQVKQHRRLVEFVILFNLVLHLSKTLGIFQLKVTVRNLNFLKTARNIQMNFSCAMQTLGSMQHLRYFMDKSRSTTHFRKYANLIFVQVK